MRVDFNSALQSTTAKHSQELHASLNELKELFASTVAANKRQRPAGGGVAADATMPAPDGHL